MEMQEVEDKFSELVTNYLTSSGNRVDGLLTCLKGMAALHRKLVSLNEYLTSEEITELSGFGFNLRGWSVASIYHKDNADLQLTKRGLNDWVLTLPGRGVIKRSETLSSLLCEFENLRTEIKG